MLSSAVTNKKTITTRDPSQIPPITAAQGFLLFINIWKTIFIGSEVLKRVCLTDNRHFPKRISVMPYYFPLL